MDERESLEFYLQDLRIFRADFWGEGNRRLTIQVEPRRDVESGEWFTASWLTKDGEGRHVTAQRIKLLWERIIKQYLQDERKAEALMAPES